jgi:hypothetical protein
MSKLVGEVLDGRCSGFAVGNEPARVAPVRMRHKWRPWRKPFRAWSVMQPRQELIGRSMEWVWRPVATFTEKADADEFLREFE